LNRRWNRKSPICESDANFRSFARRGAAHFFAPTLRSRPQPDNPSQFWNVKKEGQEKKSQQGAPQEASMRHHKSGVLVSLATVITVLILSRTASAQVSPPALSQARAVRLSFVEGTATVRRPGSTEWAKASVNTPIQQGFSVAAAKASFAEIQFENGSTVRLGQLSRVDFNELALAPEGDKVNHVTLDEGYATFHFIPEHHDEYLVQVSGVTVTPHGKTEFRIDLFQPQLRVEVSQGEVQVVGSHQSEKLGKEKVLTCDVSPATPFRITHGIEKDDWDKWVAARDEQSTLAYNDSAVSIDAPTYGWDDLDAYGDWGDFPGYGYGWAPYEPFGWSPYGLGMWSWYPGWGYTWISGEPWGWLPFHYGWWNFDPTMGWFWMPGSFGMWSPALVNWYSGPGWVGWGPMGFGGGTPCAVSAAGCITAVTPGTLGNGAPIRPGGPGIVQPDPHLSFRPIARPAVEPGHLAMLSGQPLSKDVVFPGGPRGALVSGDGRLLSAPAGAGARGGSFAGRPEASGPVRSASLGRAAAPGGNRHAAGFERGPIAAPSSVVMGRSVSPDTVLAHHSFFGRAFGEEARGPAHAPLGETLGGRAPTVSDARGNLMPRSFVSPGPAIGGFRGPARMGGLAFSRSSGGFARAGGSSGGFGGGSFGMARSGGVGFGGGFSGGGFGGFHGGGMAAGGHR
jgi:hypothetical protein